MSSKTSVLIVVLVLVILGIAGGIFLLNSPQKVTNGSTEYVVVSPTPTSVPTKIDETSLALHGQVFTRDGYNVENAAVLAVESGGAAYSAATDIAGRFSIEEASAGVFRLSIRKEGFRPLDVPAVRPSMSEARYTLVRLTESETMSPSPAGTERGVPSFAGVVRRYQDRMPLRGAQVRIQDSRGAVQETITNATGEFAFASVAAGTLTWSASAEGHAMFHTDAARNTVKVDGAVRDYLIELSAVGTVSGVAVNEADEAISGATLVLGLLDSHGRITRDLSSIISKQTTQDRGEFRFDDVLAERAYCIIVSHPSYATLAVEDIKLAIGETEKMLRLVLTQGASLRGRVTGADGQPAANVLMTTNARLRYAIALSPILTDVNGDYTITSLSPGLVIVEALAPDGRSGKSPEIEVQAGQTREGVDIVLNTAAQIRGIVYDPGGAPREGVTVAAAPDNNRRLDWKNWLGRSVQTGPNGEFVMGGSGDETYIVAADTVDRAGVAVQQVKPGSGTVSLTLKPGGTLSFQVVDGTNAPVQDYSIKTNFEAGPDPGAAALVPVPGLDTRRPVHDSSGRMEYNNLDAGLYEVVVSHPRFAESVDYAKVLPGETANLTVRLGSGFALAGTVVAGDDGRPVAGAEVTARPTQEYYALLSPAGTRTWRVTTDANGMFQFTAISKGSYDLTAAHPEAGEGRLSNITVDELSAKSVSQIVITLLSDGAIEGTVTGAEGLPVANAVLSALLGRDKASLTATTDAAGRYHLSDVDPGVVTVSCQMSAGDSPLLKSVEVLPGQIAKLDFGGEGLRLYGHVYAGEKPLPKATLRVRPLGSTGRELGSSVSAVTDDEGAYEFATAIPSGAHVLTVNDAWNTGVYERLELPSSVPEYEHDVRFPLNPISGVCVSSQTRQPIPRVTVILQADARSVEGDAVADFSGDWTFAGEATGDENGRFELRSSPIGRVRLLAQVEGYAPTTSAPIAMQLNTPVRNMTIQMVPESGVMGRVLDANNRAPVSGATVAAFRQEGTSFLSGPKATSDANGDFHLRALGEGEWQIASSAPGYAVGVLTGIVVPRENVAQADVLLVPGSGSFRVRVQDDAGRLMEGVRLRVRDAAGVLTPLATHGGTALWTEGWTDKTGVLFWEGLAGGPYTLVFEKAGYAQGTAPIVITPGETVELSSVLFGAR